jgi:hypothetical protein
LVDHRKHALATSAPHDKFFCLAFRQIRSGAPFYGEPEGNPSRLFKWDKREGSESMPRQRWGSLLQDPMITALSAIPGRRSSQFSKVVLPLPRKPMIADTGSRLADLSGSKRPNSASSFRWFTFQDARQVIPLLQRRGLFRTDYWGKTLREHYGLVWPRSVLDEAKVKEGRST